VKISFTPRKIGKIVLTGYEMVRAQIDLKMQQWETKI